MKMNRKAAAFITAGLMAISLCVPASMTAYAGETDSYVITVNEATQGYEYKVYQIFKGDVAIKDGKNVLSNIDWATGFNSADFLTQLKAAEEFKTVAPETEGDPKTSVFAKATTAKEVAEILKGITGVTPEQMAAFARIAKANIGTVAPVTNSAYDATDKVYPINVTGSGYYLVEETAIPEGDPAGQEEVYSRFMLNVVGPADVTPKRDMPTLDKEITAPNPKDEGKANAVNIGDTVSYKLTSDMPDMTGYEKYYYVMNDTLSEGLTFKADSVVVKIGDTTLTAAKDYEVQIQTAAAPYTFQIVFKDFVNRTEAKNTPITVTYDAVLNEKADTSTAGNLNTANLTYSNNPNKHYEGTPPTSDEPGDGEPTGKTPNRQTKTYSANVELLKVDEGGNKLTGAKFKIEGEGKKIILINQTAYEKYTGTDTTGIYYMLKAGTFTETAPDPDTKTLYDNDGVDKYKKVTGVTSSTQKDNICTEAYVNANGVLTFNGLGAGDYTITELIAPDGYNKLEQPIEFTLTDGDHTFANGPAWTVSGGGATMNADKVTVNLSIENKAGSILPSTGGIGTKLFFIFGAVMAIGSGIYLVTKKRMAGVEE